MELPATFPAKKKNVTNLCSVRISALNVYSVLYRVFLNFRFTKSEAGLDRHTNEARTVEATLFHEFLYKCWRDLLRIIELLSC
jgi:hypothetical protein